MLERGIRHLGELDLEHQNYIIKNLMVMDSKAGRNWSQIILVGGLFWTTSLAAPMQCHFNSQASCIYQGTHFSMGDSWMEDGCLQCTCLHPIGVGCCETVHRPVDFPAWCEVRLESLTCKLTLVQSADPRLPCFPGDGHNLDPRHSSLNNYRPLAE